MAPTLLLAVFLFSRMLFESMPQAVVLRQLIKS
jgi:hypothetical protein